MFEVVLVAVVIAALVPPLLLLGRVSALKNHIEQALAGSRQTDEQMRTLVAAQRDLLFSFDVFERLLACLQYSYDALSVTARAFVCVFRERAASYVERGCEGSLLVNTHMREDRLKQLALELVQQHETEFACLGQDPVRRDALDNGEFSEYLKLLKYIVQRYLSHIEGQVRVPRLACVDVV